MLPELVGGGPVGGVLCYDPRQLVDLYGLRLGWLDQAFGVNTKPKYTAYQIILLMISLILSIAG
jgi:hypothetical protein